jgi:DNA-binding transcriptional LysR family regulator
MTLDQLHIFLVVAQHLHFSRAADELYITQPAVSTAIQSLERQYKVRLFHRVGRRVELTDAGKVLQTAAKRILAEVEAAERSLQAFNNLQQGQIKIGASQTIGNYWLPRFISQFRQHYSGIEIDCTLSNTQEVSAGVVVGTFDLGLVEGDISPSMLSQLYRQTVGYHRLQIVVGRSHPWFAQRMISAEQLLSTSWVIREVGSGTRQRFEQVLQQWNIRPLQLTVAAEMKSAAMVKAAVEDGVGAAALSEMTIRKERQLDTLRTVEIIEAQTPDFVAQLSLPFLLLKHRERFQSLASQTFEQILVLEYESNYEI